MENKESQGIVDKLSKYPKTENYEVYSTIGVPHPYCIGSKLVAFTADNHSGQLDQRAIEAYEKKYGPGCGTSGCNLRYDEHKQALAVQCKINDNEKLKEYLQSICGMCEEDGFEGFVLVKGWE